MYIEAWQSSRSFFKNHLWRKDVRNNIYLLQLGPILRMSLQSNDSYFVHRRETESLIPCLIRSFQKFKESDIGIYLQCRAKSEYELPSTATSIFSDVIFVVNTKVQQPQFMGWCPADWTRTHTVTLSFSSSNQEETMALNRYLQLAIGELFDRLRTVNFNRTNSPLVMVQ